ncbi:TIGR02530 family flagellar biosynthesis protein [Brevibacillus migulae]|uniref:TIGR02530 family flagellar biosynthesis protein n=1 Tax=Brevibacillus migulae TaxID=1644114 RepID=UPI00106E7850|nr:TIGR02530 family flagellar biosynthesis protein [Brevibacillus migulae]
MANSFRVGQPFFPPKPPGVTRQPVSKPVEKPFQQWLTEAVAGDSKPSSATALSFSQHALQRLKDRGIQLSETDMTRLEQAVQKAANKGAKESLVMMDSVAYVVSVVNRKVITAVDAGHMKDNVFTNIDSAIFV